MSNIEKLNSVKQLVLLMKPKFEDLAKIHNAVNWKEEASFALQALDDNEYLAGVAMANQDSLKRAVLNVASIGLSLNPYKKLAYLVPRKNRGKMQVCLDISYLGYVQLALNIGAIVWAMCELRHKNDEFEYLGFNRLPFHKFDPSEDRGPLLGGYVAAKLPNDDVLVTYMTIEDIHNMRDRSPSWKAYVEKKTKCPWNTDYESMVKKTIFRRAKTFWPMKKDARLEAAQAAIEEADPILLPVEPQKDDTERQELILKIRTALEILERTEAAYIGHLIKIVGRDVKQLEDLTKIELRQSVVALNQLVDQKTEQELK